MKMLTSIDIKGIFISEEILRTVLHTLSALLDCSDVSLELAKVSIYITVSWCFDCVLVAYSYHKLPMTCNIELHRYQS